MYSDTMYEEGTPTLYSVTCITVPSVAFKGPVQAKLGPFLIGWSSLDSDWCLQPTFSPDEASL